MYAKMGIIFFPCLNLLSVCVHKVLRLITAVNKYTIIQRGIFSEREGARIIILYDFYYIHGS
jgi:hypothetical protein